MLRLLWLQLKPTRLLVSLAILALLPNWLSADENPIRVFAAASLKTALDEIIHDFEQDHSQDVVASYAGSSNLARQIALGAPASIFISANVEWMDDLQARGFVRSANRVNLLTNQLVVISSQSAADLSDLRELPLAVGSNRLALAQPEAVPAGIYAKTALIHAEVWTELQDNLAPTDNVRSALSLVATRAAPFGIVYATDAHAEPRVSVVFEIPDNFHPPITYPAALVADGKTGEDFFEFLQSERAMMIFKSQGFEPLVSP